ncbi:hypothetical protein GCM10020256_64110 [Streptomyces thermocoprophilus]
MCLAGQPSGVRVVAFDGAQPLQLDEGEVLGEPAGDGDAVDDLGGAAVGEPGVVGDVRGAAGLRLVPADEMPVPGGGRVAGLDDVGARVEGEPVGAEGVSGAVAAGAAVSDDRRAGQALQPASAARARRGPRGLLGLRGLCRAGQSQDRSPGAQDGGAEQGPSGGAARGPSGLCALCDSCVPIGVLLPAVVLRRGDGGGVDMTKVRLRRERQGTADDVRAACPDDAPAWTRARRAPDHRYSRSRRRDAGRLVLPAAGGSRGGCGTASQVNPGQQCVRHR